MFLQRALAWKRWIMSLFVDLVESYNVPKIVQKTVSFLSVLNLDLSSSTCRRSAKHLLSS